jgi:hypothetical protein
MKKSDWIYLANAMWSYSEKNEGKISNLLKELIIKINKGEVIIDDNDENDEINGSDRITDANTTGNSNFEGIGEF